MLPPTMALRPRVRIPRWIPDAAALERMFTTISGLFPFNFMAEEFMLSTFWESICQIVFRTFNYQLNRVSLLQLQDLKCSQGKNYFIFYRRVLDYLRQHNAGPNINVGGFQLRMWLRKRLPPRFW